MKTISTLALSTILMACGADYQLPQQEPIEEKDPKQDTETESEVVTAEESDEVDVDTKGRSEVVGESSKSSKKPKPETHTTTQQTDLPTSSEPIKEPFNLYRAVDGAPLTCGVWYYPSDTGMYTNQKQRVCRDDNLEVRMLEVIQEIKSSTDIMTTHYWYYNTNAYNKSSHDKYRRTYFSKSGEFQSLSVQYGKYYRLSSYTEPALMQYSISGGLTYTYYVQGKKKTDSDWWANFSQRRYGFSDECGQDVLCHLRETEGDLEEYIY